MKKIIIYIFLIIFLFSCKSQKVSTSDLKITRDTIVSVLEKMSDERYNELIIPEENEKIIEAEPVMMYQETS